MRLLFLSLLLQLTTFLAAQKSVDDIVVFDGYIDYPFPNHLSEDLFLDVRDDYCQLQKLIWPSIDIVPAQVFPSSDQAWAYWIHSYVTDASQALYADDELKEPILGNARKELFSRSDTVIRCYSNDPPAYEIYQNLIHLEDLIGLRVKQKLSWNNEQNKLELSVKAYAPLMSIYDENGNFQGINPLAWIPVLVSDQSQEELFKNNQVPLIVTTRTTTSSSSAYQTSLNGIDLRRIVLECLRHASPNSILDYSGQVLSIAERSKITTPSYAWKAIEDIRLYISWHWNTNTKQLHYKFDGWAPLKAEYDQFGIWMYAYPLFYRMIEAQ